MKINVHSQRKCLQPHLALKGEIFEGFIMRLSKEKLNKSVVESYAQTNFFYNALLLTALLFSFIVHLEVQRLSVLLCVVFLLNKSSPLLASQKKIVLGIFNDQK